MPQTGDDCVGWRQGSQGRDSAAKNAFSCDVAQGHSKSIVGARYTGTPKTRRGGIYIIGVPSVQKVIFSIALTLLLILPLLPLQAI